MKIAVEVLHIQKTSSLCVFLDGLCCWCFVHLFNAPTHEASWRFTTKTNRMSMMPIIKMLITTNLNLYPIRFTLCLDRSTDTDSCSICIVFRYVCILDSHHMLSCLNDSGYKCLSSSYPDFPSYASHDTSQSFAPWLDNVENSLGCFMNVPLNLNKDETHRQIIHVEVLTQSG